MVDLSLEGLRCRGELPRIDPGTEVAVILAVPFWWVRRRLRLHAHLLRADESNTEWTLRFRLEDARTAARLRAYLARAHRAHEKLIATRGDRSPLAEAFRSLRVALARGEQDRPSVILVTSAVAGEGKTFIASGLAGMLAREGERVLLLDADLYQPSLHQAFDLNPTPGLLQLLTDGPRVSVKDVAHESGDGADIITAGSASSLPSETYTHARVSQLFETLKKSHHYRWVVIDSPPLLVSAAASLLASSADKVLLTIRSGVSRHEHLRRARAVLERAGVSVWGMVLNDHQDLPGGPSVGGYLPRERETVGEEERTRDELTAPINDLLGAKGPSKATP
jgi:capsular exopolysaccharide synthesis family protein